MHPGHSRWGEFRKAAENLYRYSSNGVYYARFRQSGKEIQKSLRTSDRELVKRRRKEESEKAENVDVRRAKMCLEELLRLRPLLLVLWSRRDRLLR